MLSDRARIILFWFTIAMMVIVAVLAAMTILRACGGPTPKEPPPTISPAEISLCPGEQHQFTVAEGVDVTWEATGGRITEGGLFTAGDSTGDYTVTATRMDSSQATSAVVHIVACTPTPTPEPSPTPLPTPTPTETPAPTQEGETSPPSADAQGDVGAYETGASVEGVPAGVDLSAASVGPDLQVPLQPGEDVPAELADFAAEGELLLWVSLHEAIPDPPTAYSNWLFVLDVDGSADTGRPPGSRRINPDLGDEIALGLSYNPGTGAYESYALVWNTAEEGWAAGPDVRYNITESRQVVGLAFSLDAVREALSEVSDTTITPEAVKGRAAAETYTADGARVIDFYPDLPE